MQRGCRKAWFEVLRPTVFWRRMVCDHQQRAKVDIRKLRTKREQSVLIIEIRKPREYHQEFVSVDKRKLRT